MYEKYIELKIGNKFIYIVNKYDDDDDNDEVVVVVF
jgi:hypothetical protein